MKQSGADNGRSPVGWHALHSHAFKQREITGGTQVKQFAIANPPHQILRHISRRDDGIKALGIDIDLQQLPRHPCFTARRVADKNDNATLLAVFHQRCNGFGKRSEAIVDNPPDIAEPDGIGGGKLLQGNADQSGRSTQGRMAFFLAAQTARCCKGWTTGKPGRLGKACHHGRITNLADNHLNA